MKKLVYILLMLIITFSACNPNEDIYDDLDEKNAEYAGIIENYILTAADYSTASSAAKKDAVSIGDLDSTYAKLIKSMEAFNNYYPAEDYVGKVLAENFGEYGNGSRAYVTYNYVAELPEDLVVYSSASEYSFVDADYENVSSNVGIAGYFFPAYPADYYIPEIIKNSISGASTDDVYRVNYMYANENPVIGPITVFKESFDGGLGQFNAISIAGDKNWRGSSYDGEFYASMSGFEQNTEDWLISNPIELDDDASIIFNFTHEIKYLNHRWDQLSVAISSDYDGINIEDATWDVIDWGDVADTANLGSDYDPYNSGDLDITSYANQTIYIAFKYTSTTENAPTWHILDVTVDPIKETAEYTVVYGKKPYAKSDFYTNTASGWSKLEDVYYLNETDYAAMGNPGDDNMFSSDNLPQDYLPKFLDAKYPQAGSGVEKTIVYQYESDIDDEITLATKYKYGENGWESSYDYIQVTINQFVNIEGEWFFDPTITRELSSADYQIIVDYVKVEYGDEFLDSYKTADYIYGTSAYYKEFNIANYDETIFKEGWEQAVKEAVGVVLLPRLYADAVLQVNGVDMYYRIIFAIYESGTMTNYAVKFQVTKAGPDPEFTFDEDYGFQEVK